MNPDGENCKNCRNSLVNDQRPGTVHCRGGIPQLIPAKFIIQQVAKPIFIGKQMGNVVPLGDPPGHTISIFESMQSFPVMNFDGWCAHWKARK